MQKIEADIAPQLAKHQDGILLDPKLFARVHTLYEQKKTLGLDPIAMRLLERYHLDFVRGGANLNDADKVKLRALNEEESTLTTKFSELVLKDTNAGATIIDDVKDLDGMSATDIDAAAVASARGLTGKWVLGMINTTGQPALGSSEELRAAREDLQDLGRALHVHGEVDTRPIVARLAQLRAQRAKLLGFPSAAAFILDDQMAKTPDAAMKLLNQIGLAPRAARAPRSPTCRR